jgi:hypothetical protein
MMLPRTFLILARVITMKFSTCLVLASLFSADCVAQAPDWTLVQTATKPFARGYHAMAYDSDRKVTVLFGGRDVFVQSHNDTWEYDGKNWQEIKPPLSPSARSGHMMVYDSARKLTVLYGGPGLRDTWTWDGAVWTKIRIPAAQKPSARNSAAMAFDENRGRIVLFGGYDSLKGLVNDTWEFDGAVWHPMSSLTAAPVAREDHAMAYDSGRKRIVLFGGSDQGGDRNDVWEWNGTLWQPMTPATTSPTGRRNSSNMVYDKSRRRTLLFGGYNGGRLNDTWEWNGIDWSELTVATIPPARSNHSLVHDADRGRTVLFSGSGANNDLWEYSGNSVYMTADVTTIPIAAGGTQTLTLDAGPSHANKPYWIFGSITGTSPGVALNGIHIPLNVDVYTQLAMQNVMANPPYSGFRAVLDASGGATAQFILPSQMLNAGFTLYHSYVIFDGMGVFYGASNPVKITFQ